jgi:hypothetical protein
LLLRLLRATGHEKVTVHGLRSSFSDWAHETGAEPLVVEQSLPHGAGQKFLRTSRLRVRTDRGTRSSFSADPGVIFASADQVCVGGGSLVEMHRDGNVAVSCPSRATRPQSCPSRASLVHPQS